MHRRAQGKGWEATMVLTPKAAAGTSSQHFCQQSLHFSYVLFKLHTGSNIQSKKNIFFLKDQWQRMGET